MSSNDSPKTSIYQLALASLGLKKNGYADSRNKRTDRMNQLQDACINKVRERFAPELERIAEESLGQPKKGTQWMEFQIDDDTHSPSSFFIIHPMKLPDSNTSVAQ